MSVPLMNPTTSNIAISNPSVIKQVPTTALSYESHSYISIDGDDEFLAMAAFEEWEGDGSSGDPFVIEGYEIVDEEFLIEITNTRYNFIIQDCNLTYALAAIHLRNATSGVIQNCLIVDTYYGIVLANVTGIDVIGCHITVHPTEGTNGVYLEFSDHCSISNCIIQGQPGTDAGIYGEYCEEITLYNNTVFEFDNHGIFFGGCYDMDIIENTLYWNEGGGIGPVCGIYIVESLLLFIAQNNITENMDNGITIEETNNVTIFENHISHNWIHGVYLEDSDYCLIQNNFIEDNGEGITSGPGCGVCTYYSDYCQIIGNEFWSNILTGITLSNSDFCNIANNYLNHSWDHGMQIYQSHNVTIEENEIYNSYGLSSGGPECGIRVQESNYTSLLHNILGHNSENGITVYMSDFGEMIGNTIFDSEYDGLFVEESSGWDISYNVIYDNYGSGIVLDGLTYDNYVYYNDIGWCGEYLAVDTWGYNYWNISGVGNWYSDYNGTGTYSIFGIAEAVDYYPSMSLYCGVTTPSEYEVGTTGNTMTWNSSALNPGRYELLIDGVSQGNVTWDGGHIAADVDGLPVGEYNVTLIVYHISGHWLMNQSTLTVVDTMAPAWTVTPQDQTLDYGESLSYQLQASDPSGIASWAVNDTASFAISASGLLTNATFLSPGVYYVEITVTDIYSHSVSVTIKITVNEPAPPIDTTTLMLAIGGGGAILVIVLVVIMYKKKSS
ncbi:MAG: right-handed parallel beta-helix repeat-containing protein [Candidatus Thorarchaeota archaeon]|nr:right-handed parallel beta-helix repeat-containing protein [Candidatus Thorarchaeota archaeon]